MRIRHRLASSELFEIAFTRYGSRNVAVQPEDVEPGTRLAIRSESGYNVVTSFIQEAYLGNAVSEISGDGNFLIFDDSRASLVCGDDMEHSVPLLREGWRGAHEPLWDVDDDAAATIVQIDVAKTSLDQTSQLERDVPGWADMLAGFRGALQLVSTAEVTDGWCAVDGRLTLRLEGVPDLDGNKGRTVLALVRRAEEASGLLCVQRGSAPTTTKVVCLRREPFNMPPTVDTDTIRVELGWWGIVTDMIEQIQRHVTIDWIGVAQVDGEFIVQLRYCRVANSDVEVQITRIVESAQAAAATTCERCGNPGVRTTAPWIHVCCGQCPAAAD